MDKNQVFADYSPLNDEEFARLSQYIEGRFGIKLPPGKKTMLQGRLRKRLIALNMSGYSEYIRYLFSAEGARKEPTELIDVVSTNKTSFFREFRHFEILERTIIPEILAKRKDSKPLMVWSAGCSTGEEPYSLAFLLQDMLQDKWPAGFIIHASDVSYNVLNTAQKAVYQGEKAVDIPERFRHKYLLRSKDHRKNLIRISSEIRKRVVFSIFNLLENFPNDKIAAYDLIFCRNTLIYFDRSIQKEISMKFAESLKNGGYLFIGHSESLINMHIPLQNILPTIYQKNSM